MDFIDILKIITAVLALMIAIIGHEIMHGFIAYKYGDMTAKNAGRLSINPLIHVDMVGTIIVPAVLYFLPLLLGAGGGFIFGWAKPVPVDMRTVIMRGGYNAAMQVSLAGIVYNFTVAAFASIILVSMSSPTTADSIVYIFAYMLVMQLVVINVVLGVFNLLPIPQFDGAHFLMYLALKFNQREVAETFYKLERYGMIIVLIVIMTPLKDYLLILPVQMVLKLLLS
ncbi:site-2 protease family protein [Sulfurimonas sp. HSL-1716]|uniref:site-2 protease family protein n=1 Tax=Hydrocurvibacter sulfurireducens TaxID=3131937 RepID=UPI0031F92594